MRKCYTKRNGERLHQIRHESKYYQPKPCSYQCGTRIYWDTVSNSYLEVFTKQKHICKNRSIGKPSGNLPHDNTNRPFYYNKFSKQPKPKMSNSVELITGLIDSLKNEYEILSDIVTEYNGKVHGSQFNVNGNIVSLIVYYEVLDGKRDEVKRKLLMHE